MQKLLAELRAQLAEEDGQRSAHLGAILDEIDRVRHGPPDLMNPLAYRAAINAAADMMMQVFGVEAIAHAREIERRMPRTFARVVTRRLERLKRAAEREAETDNKPAPA